MEKKILPVLGMACAGCSANVERRLKAMDGMKSVAVSLPGRTAMVEYDESKVTPADMKKVVDAAGFELIIDEETRVDTIEKNSYRLQLRRMAVSWVLALLTMAVSMGWLAVGGRDAANQTMLISHSRIWLIADDSFMPMPGDCWFIAQPIWTRLWRCPQPSRSSSASSILSGANSSGEHVA